MKRGWGGPSQLGADPGLVDKDEVLGGDALDPFGKGGDIGARLLARPKGLFLRGKPSRLRVTQSPGRLTLTPVCAASRAPYSARVPSLSAATICRSAAHCGAPRRGAGPRPRGLATRHPSVAAARTQFFTVLTATRNRAASAYALPSAHRIHDGGGFAVTEVA